MFVFERVMVNVVVVPEVELDTLNVDACAANAKPRTANSATKQVRNVFILIRCLLSGVANGIAHQA